MRYEEVVLQRDCEAVVIPYGDPVVLPAGTEVVIMQSLGDSFTVQVPTMGGLYRIGGKDADALGKTPTPTKTEGAAEPAGPVDEKQIWDALRNVYDPEIPVNIVELGLVYELRTEPHPEGGTKVYVKMTLTAPGCGMGEFIAADAKRRIEAIPGVKEAEVELVFDPPWSQDMMSEAAKLELGLL
ncbi:MAG: putative Fe-S cluster assembly protein SufT [Candidatus Binatia bacterium]|nr:MAG: putative Fe-S cluster assembly protein SufT [Candidatus Binatia bacterium]